VGLGEALARVADLERRSLSLRELAQAAAGAPLVPGPVPVFPASRSFPSLLAQAAAKGADAGLAYPLAEQGAVIGRPYQGTHTLFGNWESQNAVDLAVPVGTPVYAVADGVIGDEIGPLPSSNPLLQGQRLHLVSTDNEFYYAHLSRILVAPGQRVRRGELIGYSGAANGVPHLHFAVREGSPEAALGLPAPRSSPPPRLR
jgi:murein DD-endopeptidase MepM/ murein hydrolase activator NlpD